MLLTPIPRRRCRRCLPTRWSWLQEGTTTALTMHRPRAQLVPELGRCWGPRSRPRRQGASRSHWFRCPRNHPPLLQRRHVNLLETRRCHHNHLQPQLAVSQHLLPRRRGSRRQTKSGVQTAALPQLPRTKQRKRSKVCVRTPQTYLMIPVPQSSEGERT